jgi:hypothetical protein
MREFVPPREFEAFGATNEYMIGYKLGYPDVQACVDAALSGKDPRPQQLQTMMSGGDVWRVIEEERAPDLTDSTAVHYAPSWKAAQKGASMGMMWSSAATQLTLPAEVEAELAGRERFLTESAGSGYRVMAEPLERESGRSLDDDGLSSWSFNFGYALRVLEPFVPRRVAD